MAEIKEFGETTKSLSRNPLGIIALFIVLIYGFASIVVGFSNRLHYDERLLIIVFMITFPVIVLGVFCWLVACHHEKLYAPKDFKSDDSFLRGVSGKEDGRPALKELDGQIESKVREVLESEEFQSEIQYDPNKRESILRAVDKITSSIRDTSFLTIDAKSFTGVDSMIFELPVGAFSTLSDLTNEIFFLIGDYIKPYEYGYTWVIRLPEKGIIIKNSRMITNTPSGVPLSDERSLEEVGIYAGMVLEIVDPKKL